VPGSAPILGIYKVPAEGGPAVLVTNKGGGEPIESPDGRFIYSTGFSASGSTLLRMPAEGGEAQTILDTDSLPDGMSYAVVEDGIYFIPMPDPKSGGSIQFLNTATGRIQRIASIEKPGGIGLTVSPDRRWILYAQVDQAGSDLMLVENFR
jgi:Tol biopolymer transport system component